MASTNNSGLSYGTNGSAQTALEEQAYSSKAEANESSVATPKPLYKPSPKHEPGHNWGSENPIKSQSEGQQLLESGYRDGKQIYNITDSGDIIKFQPDNTPENGYHAYKVDKPRDIPTSVLKQMLADNKISEADYNKIRKGKKK